MVPIASSVAVLGQAVAPRGVYQISPDPAESFPGEAVAADAQVDDGGRTSCLHGQVQGTPPPTGFELIFDPRQTPPRAAAGPWPSRLTLNVQSGVAPGNYLMDVWIQEYASGACNGRVIGSTYVWDIVVKAPPQVSPTPTPTPTQQPETPAPLVVANPSSTESAPPPPPHAQGLQDGEQISFAAGATEESGPTPPNPTLRSGFVLAADEASDSVFDPKKLAVSLGIALCLTLLVAFPGELVAKTVQNNGPRIRNALRFLPRRRPGLLRKLSRSWLGFLLVLLITAVLYGLLSPDFGINLKTFVLVLGMLGSIGIIVAANELTAALYMRKRSDRVYLRVFPGTLAIAIACVAISRLVDFEPGYLYGLVAGVAVRGALDSRTEGKAAAIASACLLGVAVAAWAIWHQVEPAASRPDASTALLIGEALLVATFVAGFEALLFGLLPLTFLDGQKLIRWNRLVWVILFVITAFFFVHMVLNPATSYVGLSQDTTTLTVLGLFVGFGLFSVAFWAYLRFTRPRAGLQES
jgi:hypothetical protein